MADDKNHLQTYAEIMERAMDREKQQRADWWKDHHDLFEAVKWVVPDDKQLSAMMRQMTVPMVVRAVALDLFRSGTCVGQHASVIRRYLKQFDE